MAEIKDQGGLQSDPVTEENPVDPVHPVNEDPEDHIGRELPDPWDDSEQTDWPNGSVDVPGGDN